MTGRPGQERHSESFFGADRDHYWHVDFLDLMATRLELESCRRVLDVGAGVGHWTACLLPRVHPEARIVGVEPEPGWVRRARARIAGAGLEDRIEFREGTAETLPVEDVAALAKLYLTLERGKQALGEGFDSVGDLLPGLLREQGLEEIRVWTGDRPATLVPPHDAPGARELLESELAWIRKGCFATLDEAAARRHFLAGGGREAEFASLWALAMERNERVREALEAGTSPAGGLESSEPR